MIIYREMNTQSAWLSILVSMIVTSTVLSSHASTAEGEKYASMKPASQLINAQEPGKVFPEVLSKAPPGSFRLIVILSKQRAYLMSGSRIAIETPISSGRRHGWTPSGEFVVLEKDPNHYSSLYGEFVDSLGHTVRSGVSSRLNSAPSGTHFRGAPMKYFMRLTPAGVGLHAGILPGYPASHGCIRLPLEMAGTIYKYVTLQTPVLVAE